MELSLKRKALSEAQKEVKNLEIQKEKVAQEKENVA